MFFAIPSQPMDAKEESAILAATGCPQSHIDTLLVFAEKYRSSMSADNVLKNRKLGTRTLVRIARRLALYPQDVDLRSIIQRSLLAEFLPATEKMNLNTLLEDSNIFKITPPVGFIPNEYISEVLIYILSLSLIQVRLSTERHSFSQGQVVLEERPYRH